MHLFKDSASEIMRMAMIRVNKKLDEIKEPNCKIFIAIHDELFFEVS